MAKMFTNLLLSISDAVYSQAPKFHVLCSHCFLLSSLTRPLVLILFVVRPHPNATPQRHLWMDYLWTPHSVLSSKPLMDAHWSSHSQENTVTIWVWHIAASIVQQTSLRFVVLEQNVEMHIILNDIILLTELKNKCFRKSSSEGLSLCSSP